jgi:hypothetical protein
MTRRDLLLTAIGLSAAPSRAFAKAGVHVTGRLDSTDSERTEKIANFGKAFAIIVNDDALWHALSPMLNTDVNISIFQA